MKNISEKNMSLSNLLAERRPPGGWRPTDAVAARFDLLPKASAERDFFGAIDAKVLAVGAAAGVVRAEAVSGPPEVAVITDAANKSAANRSAVNETRGAAESEAPRTVWLRGDEEPAEAGADDEGDADDGAFDWRFVPRPAAALCAEHAGQPDRFDFSSSSSSPRRRANQPLRVGASPLRRQVRAVAGNFFRRHRQVGCVGVTATQPGLGHGLAGERFSRRWSRC